MIPFFARPDELPKLAAAAQRVPPFSQVDVHVVNPHVRLRTSWEYSQSFFTHTISTPTFPSTSDYQTTLHFTPRKVSKFNSRIDIPETSTFQNTVVTHEDNYVCAHYGAILWKEEKINTTVAKTANMLQYTSFTTYSS